MRNGCPVLSPENFVVPFGSSKGLTLGQVRERGEVFLVGAELLRQPECVSPLFHRAVAMLWNRAAPAPWMRMPEARRPAGRRRR